MELRVIKQFRDKLNKEKKYQAGEILTVDDIARINDLVSRGLCVIAEETANREDGASIFDKFELDVIKDALSSIGVQVAKNAGVPATSKKIAELTEEQSVAFKEILFKE